MAWGIPLAIGLGTSLIGGIMGSNNARAQRKDANRREKYNQMMSSIENKHRAFSGNTQGHRLQEFKPSISPAGAWAKAGLGGLQQGMNVYGAMKQNDMNKEYLDILKNQGGGGGAGQVQPSGIGSAYSSYTGQPYQLMNSPFKNAYAMNRGY